MVLSGTKKRARGPSEFPGGASGLDPNTPLLKAVYACPSESASPQAADQRSDIRKLSSGQALPTVAGREIA